MPSCFIHTLCWTPLADLILARRIVGVAYIGKEPISDPFTPRLRLGYYLRGCLWTELNPLHEWAYY